MVRVERKRAARRVARVWQRGVVQCFVSVLLRARRPVVYGAAA